MSFADDPDGPKWEEASREFQAAFADSSNYQFMNNLGLCALHLERDADAIAAYEGFLAKATDAESLGLAGLVDSVDCAIRPETVGLAARALLYQVQVVWVSRGAAALRGVP